LSPTARGRAPPRARHPWLARRGHLVRAHGGRVKVLYLLLLVPLALLLQCVAVSTVPFATPQALSLASTRGLQPVAQAEVRWQGPWFYTPSSKATPDGVTVVSAVGGGNWVRGSTGWPGALQVGTWWVDSVLGDDANTCTSPGASASPGGAGACRD